jgi:hypothetical protein
MTGTSDFPKGKWGFDPDGDADPDTFKVEVVDPSRPATVQVKLRALKPNYDSKQVIAMKQDDNGNMSKDYDPFPAGDADSANREINVNCGSVSPSNKVRFRSRYLRLVTDNEDFHELSPSPNDGTAQALLVTDLADGNNTKNDWLEILDQQIEAAYVVQGCPAPAPDKCMVVAQVPISPKKQRIALCVHIFRTTVGGGAVGGAGDAVAIRNTRRRLFKWFRRAYAQAGFAPMLVDPQIQIIDPPRQNAIVIGEGDGTAAAGDDGAGTASKLTITLGAPPPAPLPFPDVTFTVPLEKKQSPADVGAAIVAAVPKGFAAVHDENPVSIGRKNGSCDVIFTKADGKPIVVKSAATDDASLPVAVIAVNVDAVPANATPVAGGDADIPFNPESRRLIRSVVKPAEDRLDCFVIGSWTPNHLRGRAWTPDLNLPKKHRAKKPLRYAAIMAQTSFSGAVMDGGDNLPFTFPHEVGHVMYDTFHALDADPNGRSQLLASGTSPANAVGATKRICDSVEVKYARWSANQLVVGNTTETAISAVARLKNRGKPMFRPW